MQWTMPLCSASRQADIALTTGRVLVVVSGLLAVLALPLMALAFVAALLLPKALPHRLTTEFHPVRK